MKFLLEKREILFDEIIFDVIEFRWPSSSPSHLLLQNLERLVELKSKYIFQGHDNAKKTVKLAKIQHTAT